jgi:2-succinyl-5-enolpyruvyl-6-hydroxy-3-cyclohexene-1-carboxylate synthase
VPEAGDLRSAPNRNAAFATALLAELVRAGVRHVCVCPGSRSAPLALAAAEAAGLRAWTHVDERAAAFFALGLAKASRTPVALVCTSGTAAANFLPAVVEASLARVPLVVLTADRPPELRGWGAAQTIDQIGLFGTHVRWFAEAPLPSPSDPALRHARALASRAVAVATSRPAGPVHLDLPFREPLDAAAVAGDVARLGALKDDRAARGREGAPYTRVASAAAAPDSALVAELAGRIAATERGVVACGPLDPDPGFAAAVARLARAAGWPLLADVASGLRCGPHVAQAPLCGAYDAALRDPAFARAHLPRRVLRFGAPLTSKAATQWFDAKPETDLWLVDADGGFSDPSHRAEWVLRFDPTLFCDALAEALESRRSGGRRARGAWLRSFLEAERRARAALASAIAREKRLLAPRVVAELADALPDGAALFVSNSMPVRDADAYLAPGARRLRVLASRGANGIDGIVSTALGAAAAHDGPLVLLTGDLAFVHDAGGLLAARSHRIPGAIVVVNDDGGGIFSYLPLAESAPAATFERYFRAPHGLDLAALAAAFGARTTRAEDPASLRAALDDALAGDTLHVIEVPVEHGANVAHHRALSRAVSDALK